MEPFQGLIGQTVVCVASDVEKRGISFALASGEWQHYAFLKGVKLAHIDNAANLGHGEILGVQATEQVVPDINTVECIVNFDIRDQPESIIRFEIDTKELSPGHADTYGFPVRVPAIVGTLIPIKEDF